MPPLFQCVGDIRELLRHQVLSLRIILLSYRNGLFPFSSDTICCERSFQSLPFLNKVSKIGFEILNFCVCSPQEWHQAFSHVCYVISYRQRRKKKKEGRERERMREGDLPLSTVILNWNCANLLTQSATSFLMKLPIMSLIIFTSKKAALSLFLHKVCIFFSEALQPYCFYELKKPKAHQIDFTVLCYRIT